MRWLKRLYEWVLNWATHPSAVWILFLLGFAESSFFPVPPDVLLIPLVLATRKRWWRLALGLTLASALGGALGYGIGHWLWWSGDGGFSGLAQFFFRSIPGFSASAFTAMQTRYEAYGFWIVFTAGFTPVPYKIFTISSGAFALNFPVFMIASLVSRGARFFLVAWLIQRFGEPIRRFIDRYFDWLALVLVVLLVLGFWLTGHGATH